ncbi:hypothetical protein GWK47_024285 [Chionoecetes opilio]|uniref:Cuticle protein 6 n=1 Tax=Chionoecetes opilio TaxID=41210 RepID=A0A8J4XLW4_CHIOP|nr:hypothetical protein GWK47_024285 [Chionoecetes opilio]
MPIPSVEVLAATPLHPALHVSKTEQGFPEGVDELKSLGSPVPMPCSQPMHYFRLAVVLVMGVGITLVLRGFVLEADKLRQVMRAWRDAGPHTTVLGKVRRHLAVSWLASPRDPLAECGFPLGDSWGEVLPMVVGSKERLACLERQVQKAEQEHKTFVFWFVLIVYVAVVVVFVALVAGCSWARQTLARHHCPYEKGSEAVPLPAPGRTAGRASPAGHAAASQEVKHTEVEDVLEEAGEQVLPLQEPDPVTDQNSLESQITADAGEDEEANCPVRRNLLVPRRFMERLKTGAGKRYLHRHLGGRFSVLILVDAAPRRLHIKGALNKVPEYYVALKTLLAEWRTREAATPQHFCIPVELAASTPQHLPAPPAARLAVLAVLAAVSVAWAAPVGELRAEHRELPHDILSGLPVASPNSFSWSKPDGSYRYGMQGDDQWRVESRDADGAVQGRYVYKTPEGRVVDVSYESGPQGYRARGDAIPGGAAPLDQVGQDHHTVVQDVASLRQDQLQQTQDTRDKFSSPYGALLLRDVEKTQPSGNGVFTFSDADNFAIITDVFDTNTPRRPLALSMTSLSYLESFSCSSNSHDTHRNAALGQTRDSPVETKGTLLIGVLIFLTVTAMHVTVSAGIGASYSGEKILSRPFNYHEYVEHATDLSDISSLFPLQTMSMKNR